MIAIKTTTLHKKCPYSMLFWCAFSRIQNEYGGIRSSSPYSVRMRESADENNFAYGHFLRSAKDESNIELGLN